MPPAYRWKRRFAVFRSRSLCVYNRKISPGRFFWVVRNGSLLRGLFSYKSPLFCKPIFDLQNSPAKALEPQRISSSAELDQQALPAGHPPPFEKGGRKLYLQKLGAALSLAPNRPPEGWDGFIKSVVGWELFLLQKVPQSARDISLADFPFKRRLTIKVFRALRSSTSRRCPLDTRFLLKRKRNFISRNWVPRGRRWGHRQADTRIGRGIMPP